MSEQHNPRTAEYRGRYAPGYEAMLRMTAQMLAEFAPRDGTILVLGAGGGLEIEALSKAFAEWRFLAVDPDRTMLDAARERTGACGAQSRVLWVDGVISDAPRDVVCHGATCLLTLHFVPDDGAKLDTLHEVRERLHPGAPLVLVDFSVDRTAADFERWLRRYYLFGLNSGLDAESMGDAVERIRSGELHMISPQRTQALLLEAGFSDPQLFYVAFGWRGWITYAA